MTDWNKKWPAPAKLNLMLRITGRREDGYHLLQTVFQMTDLCDWLTFHPLEEDEVRLQNPIPGVPQEQDLIVRAANLLKQETGCQEGVCVELEKNIPMGGGLGGGSSDAATTLLVLNHLWDLNVSKARLMELGLQLGADVPVFIFGYAAWGEGVGEKLEKLDIPEKHLVILQPDCHIDTKEIFLHKELTRDSKSITMVEFLAGDHKNDCSSVVCKSYQIVEKAMEDLSLYSEGRLTGTGACVFAEFDSEELANNAFKELNKRWNAYLTKGKNKSPLLETLG